MEDRWCGCLLQWVLQVFGHESSNCSEDGTWTLWPPKDEDCNHMAEFAEVSVCSLLHGALHVCSRAATRSWGSDWRSWWRSLSTNFSVVCGGDSPWEDSCSCWGSDGGLQSANPISSAWEAGGPVVPVFVLGWDTAQAGSSCRGRSCNPVLGHFLQMLDGAFPQALPPLSWEEPACGMWWLLPVPPAAGQRWHISCWQSADCQQVACSLNPAVDGQKHLLESEVCFSLSRLWGPGGDRR